MKKNIKKIVVGALLFPVFALAQVAGQITNVDDLITRAGALLNSIVPLILALTFVWFIWNLAHFISSNTAGDEKARTVAINNIIWSIIAMFVMISVWGLVGILKGTFTLTPVNIKEIKAIQQ